MAQTNVGVTQGSGKNIDGFTTAGTGNVRQAVVLADPTTDANTATVTASNALKVDNSSVTQPTGGDVANAVSDSGSPIKIGGVAKTTNPTAVTDGQRVNARFDKTGRFVMVNQNVRELIVDQTTTITSSTSETTIGTAVASTFLDLLMVTVANTSATATRVDFRDVIAGSVRFSLYAPAGQTVGFVPSVPLTQTTVNTAWTAQSSVSVSDLRIFVQLSKNI